MNKYALCVLYQYNLILSLIKIHRNVIKYLPTLTHCHMHTCRHAHGHTCTQRLIAHSHSQNNIPYYIFAN